RLAERADGGEPVVGDGDAVVEDELAVISAEHGHAPADAGSAGYGVLDGPEVLLDPRERPGGDDGPGAGLPGPRNPLPSPPPAAARGRWGRTTRACRGNRRSTRTR